MTFRRETEKRNYTEKLCFNLEIIEGTSHGLSDINQAVFFVDIKLD